jgi:predicted RNA-binding protein with PIN domain
LAELAVRLTIAERPVSSSPRAEWLRMGRQRRFTAVELDRVRQIIASDDEFRWRLRTALNPDTTSSEILEWLDDPSDGAASQRQRRAAEHARDRARDELDQARRDRDRLQQVVNDRDEALEKMRDEQQRDERRLEQLEAQLHKVVGERDATRGELTRQQAAWEQTRSQLSQQLGELTALCDELLRQRVELDEREADAAVHVAGPGRVSRPVRPGRPPRRVPLGVPGGLVAESTEVARHLLERTDVVIVIDGYNAVLDPWTEGHLSQRRQVLLTALDAFVARRGPRAVVVFDGAADAAAGGARRLCRVVFSPGDVSADDVVCDEIERLPTSWPVVVVTDDQGLIRRVRRQGANVVGVAQLWGVLRS